MLKHVGILAILLVLILSDSIAASEIDGWIWVDVSWVVERPSKDAKIVGYMKRPAAITVEDTGGEWVKLVYAPVQDSKGKFIESECREKGCYIQRSNMTTISPREWMRAGQLVREPPFK